MNDWFVLTWILIRRLAWSWVLSMKFCAVKMRAIVPEEQWTQLTLHLKVSTNSASTASTKTASRFFYSTVAGPEFSWIMFQSTLESESLCRLRETERTFAPTWKSHIDPDHFDQKSLRTIVSCGWRVGDMVCGEGESGCVWSWFRWCTSPAPAKVG